MLIADAIAKEVVGSNRDRIAQRVEDEYERLLVGALIVTHIPSLTAGLVRREANGAVKVNREGSWNGWQLMARPR